MKPGNSINVHTYCFQKAEVLPERAHAPKHADDEHDDADGDDEERGVRHEVVERVEALFLHPGPNANGNHHSA